MLLEQVVVNQDLNQNRISELHLGSIRLAATAASGVCCSVTLCYGVLQCDTVLQCLLVCSGVLWCGVVCCSV